MKRRNFIATTSGVITALMLPLDGEIFAQNNLLSDNKTFLKDLLKDWCDGMMAHQIDEPNHPERHGALWCPACETIHGRCIDAVYPFLYMGSDLECMLRSNERTKLISEKNICFYDTIMHIIFFRKTDCFSAEPFQMCSKISISSFNIGSFCF